MSARRMLVVGATSWGCTLAIQLRRAGTAVTLLCRTAAEADRLSAVREERRLLPGIILPDEIHVTADACAGAPYDAVIFAVPAQTLRRNAQAVIGVLGAPLPPLVSASKGLEVGTDCRMSQVLAAVAGADARIGVISGPNIAREIALGQQAATVVASTDAGLTVLLRERLMTPAFRVYTNADVVGVELGGALKNVIAIGVGIGDALNAGDNGRAAFLTRGLAEMARLAETLGGNPLTSAGLACLGDLIVTAFSRRSRNRYVGEELGKGRALPAILAGMVHVAEGVETTRAARDLARRHGVEMPITEMTYRVLFEGESAEAAIQALMTRAPQDELAGLSRMY